MLDNNLAQEAFMVTTVTAQDKIKQKPLRDSVKTSVKNYLSQLGDQEVDDLYDMVLVEIEQPLLDMVMQHTRGNQTKAANMMGINRGTLRKKLKRYGMN